MAEDTQTGNEDATESQESAVHPDVEPLFPDGELDEQTLKDKAQKVRRTMRKAKHFSRQDKPLKRSRSLALESVEQLKTLASFQDGLEDGNWSVFAKQHETIADCIDPFYAFFRSHGKLPDIDPGEALALVLYTGVSEGTLDLGTTLEISRDTPRGSYP